MCDRGARRGASALVYTGSPFTFTDALQVGLLTDVVHDARGLVSRIRGLLGEEARAHLQRFASRGKPDDHEGTTGEGGTEK
ncbi:MAG: hypothetical protein V7607_6178 [Solirubrobacteraceae bacterium]